MQGNIKGSNAHVIGAPKGEMEEVETEKNPEEIMSKISPNGI